MSKEPKGSSGSTGNGASFTYKGSGTNPQGNHYCARDYSTSHPSAPNKNTYHYSNQGGSYYYSNPSGSKYYNDGQGGSRYTPPSKK
ncbi:unnamed protein product [Calypogeia fissa]